MRTVARTLVVDLDNELVAGGIQANEVRLADRLALRECCRIPVVPGVEPGVDAERLLIVLLLPGEEGHVGLIDEDEVRTFRIGVDDPELDGQRLRAGVDETGAEAVVGLNRGSDASAECVAGVGVGVRVTVVAGCADGAYRRRCRMAARTVRATVVTRLAQRNLRRAGAGRADRLVLVDPTVGAGVPGRATVGVDRALGRVDDEGARAPNATVVAGGARLGSRALGGRLRLIADTDPHRVTVLRDRAVGVDLAGGQDRVLPVVAGLTLRTLRAGGAGGSGGALRSGCTSRTRGAGGSGGALGSILAVDPVGGLCVLRAASDDEGNDRHARHDEANRLGQRGEQRHLEILHIFSRKKKCHSPKRRVGGRSTESPNRSVGILDAERRPAEPHHYVDGEENILIKYLLPHGDLF